jgi:beta-lactamase regulating signal transducer with metallopeptidase domain
MSWLSLYSPLSLSFLPGSLFASLPTVAEIWVEHVFNALPAGMLIALFAWVLLRVIRKQNSGTRFAVWFIALLTVAALPMLGSVSARNTPILAGMSSAMAASWGSMRPAIHISPSWGMFVFLAWAFGASVTLARLAAGLWQLRRLRQSCIPVVTADLDPSVRKTIAAIASSSVERRASSPVPSAPSDGQRRWSSSITVATSDCVRVPAAIGFWKRTIILPAWTLRDLPPEDLNAILLHEYAHLRRGDDWTNLIQKIVRALFFFHPAVWWIENRLSVEREMACDDAVLAETSNPHGYATCLVSLLEKSLAHRLSQPVEAKRWSMAQAAVRRAREASLRLAQILDSNRPVATQVWKPALGMVSAFSIACLLALPLAPQFVAFDRNSEHVYSAAIVQPPAQLQSLMPAPEKSLTARLDASPSLRADARATRRSITPVKSKLTSTPALAPHTNAAPLPDPGVAQASADEKVVPQIRTVVFFETARYMAPDSTVWSVRVWRVMLVTEVSERASKVPVTNSI